MAKAEMNRRLGQAIIACPRAREMAQTQRTSGRKEYRLLALPNFDGRGVWCARSCVGSALSLDANLRVAPLFLTQPVSYSPTGANDAADDVPGWPGSRSPIKLPMQVNTLVGGEFGDGNKAWPGCSAPVAGSELD